MTGVLEHSSSMQLLALTPLLCYQRTLVQKSLRPCSTDGCGGLETAVSSIQLSVVEELSIPIASAEQIDKLIKSFEQEAQIKKQMQQLRGEHVILAASFWSL